jgi:hypothetical protein
MFFSPIFYSFYSALLEAKSVGVCAYGWINLQSGLGWQNGVHALRCIYMDKELHADLSGPIINHFHFLQQMEGIRLSLSAQQ